MCMERQGSLYILAIVKADLHHLQTWHGMCRVVERYTEHSHIVSKCQLSCVINTVVKQASTNYTSSQLHLMLLSLTILGAICMSSCFRFKAAALLNAATSTNSGGLRRRIFGSLWRLQGLGQHKLQHLYAHCKDATSPQSQSICFPVFCFVGSTGIVLLKSAASFNSSSMLRARECRSCLK